MLDDKVVCCLFRVRQRGMRGEISVAEVSRRPTNEAGDLNVVTKTMLTPSLDIVASSAHRRVVAAMQVVQRSMDGGAHSKYFCTQGRTSGRSKCEVYKLSEPFRYH